MKKQYGMDMALSADGGVSIGSLFGVATGCPPITPPRKIPSRCMQPHQFSLAGKSEPGGLGPLFSRDLRSSNLETHCSQSERNKSMTWLETINIRTAGVLKRQRSSSFAGNTSNQLQSK